MATVTEAYCISEGSEKETNHYVISLKGSGIRYKPGDSLGFYPTNNHELVKKTIRKIGAKKKDRVEVKDGKDVFVYLVLLSQHPYPCSSNLLISYLPKLNLGALFLFGLCYRSSLF